tara:strand:- start:426 stop:650 length:225 start_codon:yes stop_codon:yes gene_type:complete
MFLGWEPHQWEIARSWFGKNRVLSKIPDTPEHEYDFYAQLVAEVQSCRKAHHIKREWLAARGKDPVDADRYFDE